MRFYNRPHQYDCGIDAATVAVDLARDIFEVAVANRAWRVVERKRLTRRRFEGFLGRLSSGSAIVMEARGTAHSWGRRCQTRGLRVQLLPPQFIRPYVRRNEANSTAGP